ncbi:O-antigen translocase [Morganella morganii]|uniref:O-antigen translocase n=1 Tax=Morganella morganii TaxID=582 RepID=UPI0034E4B60A
MTLIKTSILSLIATFFKMLSGLVINKAVSVYIGPSGLALIGQFQNFTQVALIAAQGAINNGVIKYTSEYSHDKKSLSSLLSTALKISISTSILSSILIVLFSKKLSYLVLSRDNLYPVFILLGITITLFVLNSLFLSILNGLKEIVIYIKINIAQSILSLIFTSILIFYYGLNGALISLATNQSIVFFITLFIIRKNKIIKINYFKRGYDRKIAMKLFSFSFMAIISALSLPITQFIIRNYTKNNFGAEQAGYLQGIWYISSIYLMIVTTALGTYYLPKLSELKTKKKIIAEIKNGYKILLPITIFCSLIIYLSKDIIINILFSKDFIDMRHLFSWQVTGDVFKISSWLISYTLLAKAKTYTFILTEVIFSLTLIILSLIFIAIYGAEGATIAYLINYVIYFICMIIIFKNLNIN